MAGVSIMDSHHGNFQSVRESLSKIEVGNVIESGTLFKGMYAEKVAWTVVAVVDHPEEKGTKGYYRIVSLESSYMGIRLQSVKVFMDAESMEFEVEDKKCPPM